MGALFHGCHPVIALQVIGMANIDVPRPPQGGQSDPHWGDPKIR